jgi:putative oxidoreductase
MKKLNQFFELRKAYGVIFLRLIVGWRLMAGAWNYVFQVKPISEVEGFFTKLNLSAPLLSAYLSVYAQFICGLLFIIGLWFRPAAIVMIMNFTVAIIAAHLNDGVEKSFAAWVILATSCFFLFNGAGKVSVENRIKL